MNTNTNSKVYRDARALICSEYISILPSVLDKLGGKRTFSGLFLVALMVRTVENNTYFPYDGRKRKGLLKGVGLSITSDAFLLEFESAILACQILIFSKTFVAAQGFLLYQKEQSKDFSSFSNKLIKTCKTLDDKYIFQEVLNNVYD